MPAVYLPIHKPPVKWTIHDRADFHGHLPYRRRIAATKTQLLEYKEAQLMPHAW